MTFYLDTAPHRGNRYDLNRFMAYREGMHDAFDSFFLAELRKLPASGEYTVTTHEQRPDVYSRDIYGKTDYWALLLEYNDVVFLSELKLGATLRYPKLDAIESLYFGLQARRQ